MSGSYSDVVGQTQVTKVLTLTFLMWIFPLRCQEFIYRIVTFCLLGQISRKYLRISGGTNESDAVDMVRRDG